MRIVALFARNCVLQPTNKLDPNFCGRITFDLILNKPALNFQLNHLKSTTNAAIDDSVVAKIDEVRWKLNKLCQRIVVEHEREFVARSRPVGDCWLDIQIHSKVETKINLKLCNKVKSLT